MKADLFGTIMSTVGEIKKDFTKYAPQIWTGLGIGGYGFSLYLTGKGAIKAHDKLNTIRAERNYVAWDAESHKFKVLGTDDLTFKEKVKETYTDFIPSAIGFTASTFCVLKGVSVSQRRTAVIASAYKLLEEGAREYKAKVIETIGEKKEKQIVDAIAEDKIKKNPPESTQIIFTNKGNTLFYETISGRYFKFDIDKVKKIENELNYRLRENNYVSVNELYLELGLELTDIGYEIGWDVGDGMLDFDYSSKLTKDDEPCVVIEYSRQPKAGYSLFY